MLEHPDKPDQFVSEWFISGTTGSQLVEWNYRDRDGVLHAGVARSEGEAVASAAVFGYLDDVIEAGEKARAAYRDEQRNTALADITRATKWAIAKGALRSDLQAALQAGGANVALQQIAEGASKPQAQIAVAVHTKVNRNGNSRHGYLLQAPLLAPLPSGLVGSFFIESPGDNIGDLFACAPDVQWPAYDIPVAAGYFSQLKASFPEPPRVAVRADQIVFRGD